MEASTKILDAGLAADEHKGTDAIHFLRTGSSDAILLESGGQFALIDCAEDSDNPRGFAELAFTGFEDEVLAYLKAHAADENGNVRLAFIVGTHSHSDHIGGFDTVIADRNVFIEKAYLKAYDESKITDYEVNNWDNKEVYQQMVDALHAKNVPILSEIEEKPFMFGNFQVTLLNTTDNDPEKVGENDRSLGVLLENGGARIFLAGDINNVNGDEDRLAPVIGAVDLLKVGHHSYSGSTTEEFLQTLRPKVCVITNDQERVDQQTLDRISDIAHSTIYITGAENGVKAVIEKSGEIRYFNNIH